RDGGGEHLRLLTRFLPGAERIVVKPPCATRSPTAVLRCCITVRSIIIEASSNQCWSAPLYRSLLVSSEPREMPGTLLVAPFKIFVISHCLSVGKYCFSKQGS